jgi:DNA-directed RNA polymerase specialized sigma24 family protein
VTLTLDEWKRYAASLLKRWQVPAAVEVSDVVQELLMSVSRHLAIWDSTRAAADKFLVWSATTETKRWLHRQRSAKRLDDRSPSRHPFSFSTFPWTERSTSKSSDDLFTASDISASLEVEADQDQNIERSESITRVLKALNASDQYCVIALVSKGSVDEAARVVYDDAGFRLACRFRGPVDARRRVMQAASRAAHVAAS